MAYVALSVPLIRLRKGLQDLIQYVCTLHLWYSTYIMQGCMPSSAGSKVSSTELAEHAYIHRVNFQ